MSPINWAAISTLTGIVSVAVTIVIAQRPSTVYVHAETAIPVRIENVPIETNLTTPHPGNFRGCPDGSIKASGNLCW